MRASIIAIVASLLLATVSFAESAKVWVSPFTEADGKQPDWITRSLSQALTDELATLKTIDVQMSKQPTDATFIVKGVVQRIDGGLRVTGNVQDVGGKNIGGFKATGSERELFAMEDQIATQVAKLVAPGEPLTSTAPVADRKRELIGVETPFAPVGGFDGSDLERSMREGVRRPATPPVIYTPPTTYVEPTYPVRYGLNGNYYTPTYGGFGGYGYGGYWSGGNQFIFINKGNGAFCPPTSGGGVAVPDNNGQAIRHRASWAGNAPPTMVHTMPGPQLVPGGASTSTGQIPANAHSR